ncbi:hypothetical protein D3C78_1108670 [compost metagenome]
MQIVGRQPTGDAQDIQPQAIDDAVVATAETEDEAVIAGTAIQRVVTAVAAEDVVQGIADAVDVGRAGQLEVFHVRAQAVTHRSPYGVDTLVGGFDHQIAGIVHHVGVVPRAAGQVVDTGTAIQPIIARATQQLVVTAVALENVVLSIADA